MLSFCFIYYTFKLINKQQNISVKNMHTQDSHFTLGNFAHINAILSLQLLDDVDPPSQLYPQFTHISPHIQQISSGTSHPQIIDQLSNNQQQQEQSEDSVQIRCATAPNLQQIHQAANASQQSVEQQSIPEIHTPQISYQEDEQEAVIEQKQPVLFQRQLSKKTTLLTIQEIKEQQKLDTEEANMDSQEQPIDLSYIKRSSVEIEEDARLIIESMVDEVEKKFQIAERQKVELVIPLAASQTVCVNSIKKKTMKIYNKTIDLSISREKEFRVESGRKTRETKKIQNFNVISAKKNPSFPKKDFSLKMSEKNSGLKKGGSGFFMCTEVPYESLPTQINFSLGDEETLKSARTMVNSPRQGSARGKGLTLMSSSNKKSNNHLSQNQERLNVIKIQSTSKKNPAKGTCIKLMNLKGKNSSNGCNKKTTVHKTIDLNRNLATEPIDSARRIKKININASNTTCNPANYFSGRRISVSSSSLTHRFL